jgi:hypothetical protein
MDETKNLIESDLQCNLWLCPPYLPIIDLLKKNVVRPLSHLWFITSPIYTSDGPPYAQYTFCQYFLKKKLASFWRNYKTKVWLSFDFLYKSKMGMMIMKQIEVKSSTVPWSQDPIFWNKTPRSTVLPFWSRIQELYISDNYAA